jgi:hypothetical protein
MGAADYYAPGQWNFRCQECYKKLKSGEALRRWDNLWVGPECYEIRNPQDFQRGIPDNQNPPWTTGDPPPIFVTNTGSTTTQNMYGMVLNGYMLNGRSLG